jgi:hypothetical protein
MVFVFAVSKGTASEQRMPSLAACRNFGMSFALSPLYTERQILISTVAPVVWSQDMYHMEDIVKTASQTRQHVCCM